MCEMTEQEYLDWVDKTNEHMRSLDSIPQEHLFVSTQDEMNMYEDFKAIGGLGQNWPTALKRLENTFGSFCDVVGGA